MISENIDNQKTIEIKKRQYNKKKTEIQPSQPTPQTTPTPTPTPQQAKPKSKPRAKREKKPKEESDEEHEVNKIKQIISSNEALKKDLEETIKKYI